MSYLAEERDNRLISSDDLLHYSDVAIPSESGMVDTTGYSTVWLTEVEDDNQGVQFIADHNGLRKMTDRGILIASVTHSEDSDLHSYPSIYSLAKASDGVEYGYNYIVDGMVTRHESHNIQPFHGKDKQRRVLEQCKTSSFVTPTIRKPPYMCPNEDTSTHGHSSRCIHFICLILSLSLSLSLSKPNDDKPSLYCITNPSYTIGRTDEMTLVSCDTAGYDFFIPAGGKVHIYKCVLNGNSSSQVPQGTQSLSTQIKKGPNVAFMNTTTIDNCATMGITDSPLCSTKYEMVNLSANFDQEQTL
ncbi:hypothetical protein ACJMK2_031660 [Sinanodonta woodiana]|uniref:Uncharacterized protein n=1 Tax=Sinanodonta woodiana TaxID=1069815 RepID=A0ABD3WZG2_SINWO